MALPTIVFIPGAWHSPEYYGAVRSLLEAKGYPTVGVDLPSVGGHATMKDDAAAIRAVTEKLAAQGTKIVLVMHSYGGIPGSESASALGWKQRQAAGEPGGIVALVYIAAYMLEEGGSIMSFAKDGQMPHWLTVKDGLIYYDESEAIPNMYGDFAPEHEPEVWASKLKPHAGASWTEGVTYVAYRDIATTYLLCMNDRSLPVDMQKQFVAAAEGRITVQSCDSAHSPMITIPELVEETIIRAAEAVDAEK
ncbi:alpha/beta-hydrolase [Aspergillus granulosus]|uniref:Alpha/beta-hydrolase n=1 Tax=Aspergillus granulosus TaxID=176169 RepID=A0ABR4H7Y4_9EURO